jgi:hypothetical protein
MGRPARWKLTPNPPGAPLMSLTWFLARWHVRGRSAPPRQCILWAIGGPSPGGDRIDRMPATDPEGRPALARNQRFWHSRNLRRVAPASGRTSSASSRSASGLLTRTVSAQRIDHYRSWQPEPSFFTPHHPVQTAEVAVDERVARLRLLRRTLGEAEMPGGVLVPGVCLQERVLLPCARLHVLRASGARTGARRSAASRA